MLFESKFLPSVTIKIGGKVKKAIDAYRQKKVPMRVMLTDYLAVKSKADLLAEAENPWAYNYKGIEGHEVESGVSHEETLFRFSAMELKNQEPSDVIEAAFYANKKRNDSGFELGYLLPLFIVDKQYIDRSGDNSYREGQRIKLNKKDLLRYIAATEALCEKVLEQKNDAMRIHTISH